eukprot:NODE_4571_length_791_cov_30.629380_g4230_i0.p1 GENE.NODE_4571_length_791_cov_30.629380_g4230_i0~~NODE_4571_length_791_cov_30.629380_g4230_i0.p1  ORF type:complete len:227 (+),score=45.34 NODE_4571_length_791_cov_30.629380_g4230_i0:72-683(+)
MPEQQENKQEGGYYLPPPPEKKRFSASNGAEEFRNTWASTMWQAPCKNPGNFCFSFFCPWCSAWSQRKQLLLGNLDNYVCCAGIFGSCSEKLTKCFPGSCGLLTEVCCCLGCAVHGNRWMVQARYQLENTCCDIFLMWLGCIFDILACFAACFIGEDEADLLRFIADLIHHTVMGCMLAQQDLELKTRKFPNDSFQPLPITMS